MSRKKMQIVIMILVLVALLVVFLLVSCGASSQECSYTLTCCGVSGKCETRYGSWEHSFCPACPMGLFRQLCMIDCYDVE